MRLATPNKEYYHASHGIKKNAVGTGSQELIHVRFSLYSVRDQGRGMGIRKLVRGMKTKMKIIKQKT